MAFCHSVGIWPAARMWLKSWMSGWALDPVSHLKVSTGMLSGPGALLFLVALRMALSSVRVTGSMVTGLGPVNGVVGPA